MPFSQASVSDVSVDADGPELFVAWSSATAGAIHQVYVDRRLAWSGRGSRCHVPRPAGSAGRTLWVHVGTVGAGEETEDFSAQLPPTAGLVSRVRLAWMGGTYLDPTGLDDVRGFHVFGSPGPGAPIDASKPIATVPASPGGWAGDGFGLGGFGGGGFGRAATAYSWESDRLATGVWRFAVVPYDEAGNARGPSQGVAVTVTEAPRPPAPLADGSRLSSQYSGPDTRLLTLSWLPSPTTG